MVHITQECDACGLPDAVDFQILSTLAIIYAGLGKWELTQKRVGLARGRKIHLELLNTAIC